MAQTHLERLRELRQWQAERDRELARRCPVPPERGAQADPGRREEARAPRQSRAAVQRLRPVTKPM